MSDTVISTLSSQEELDRQCERIRQELRQGRQITVDEVSSRLGVTREAYLEILNEEASRLYGRPVRVEPVVVDGKVMLIIDTLN